jgi:AcrR family transcriptional regulator
MPKVPKEHGEARRRQIIDAAYQCFARKGFHQTTMRDIYQETGLSAGAVYHYFDSKEAIIQASLDIDFLRSRDLFDAAVASADPLKALRELLGFFFQGLKQAAALGAGRVNVQGWGEALVNPKLMETFQRVWGYYHAAVAQAVRKAQAAGQIASDLDPAAYSQVLVSLYYGLELQKALTPDLDVDKYAAVVGTLLQPISPPVPAEQGPLA